MQLTYPLQDSVAIPQPDADRLPQFQPSGETGARARTGVTPASAPAVDQVIAYLSPFLVLTAISQSSALFAGAIDWFYPLGIAAVVVTLWICRSAYRILTPAFRASQNLTSLFTWEPIALGLVASALWALMTRSTPNPAWVAALQEGPRYGDIWLTVRLAGFALAVPIAVELAFRGYLPRRIMSADVDAIAPGTFGWVSFIGSSLWFGAIQGPYWIVGTLQGTIYAMALYRRGRVTDAIFAHIVTNTALVVYAFATNHWAAIL